LYKYIFYFILFSTQWRVFSLYSRFKYCFDRTFFFHSVICKRLQYKFKIFNKLYSEKQIKFSTFCSIYLHSLWNIIEILIIIFVGFDEECFFFAQNETLLIVFDKTSFCRFTVIYLICILRSSQYFVKEKIWNINYCDVSIGYFHIYSMYTISYNLFIYYTGCDFFLGHHFLSILTKDKHFYIDWSLI